MRRVDRCHWLAMTAFFIASARTILSGAHWCNNYAPAKKPYTTSARTIPSCTLWCNVYTPAFARIKKTSFLRAPFLSDIRISEGCIRNDAFLYRFCIIFRRRTRRRWQDSFPATPAAPARRCRRRPWGPSTCRRCRNRGTAGRNWPPPLPAAPGW